MLYTGHISFVEIHRVLGAIMVDVFISYSRKDKEFVRRLHESLESVGKETWVDWENIPLTADWLEEIYAGIEAANAFAYVISPDSVRSEVCSLELMHAIEHNKRLVPILRRELIEEGDKAALHPAVSSHNWVYFTDDDEVAFQQSFRALVEALDTDLEHLQAHTRLLVRAVEWDNKDRDSSFLLRGNDLREAEAWLANSAGKQPNPTDLHLEYINASRKAAIARRRVITLTIVYVVIVAALAVFALWQAVTAENRRQEAVAAQATAQYNAQQAKSLALASNAQRLLFRDNNIPLAIAIALEANKIDQPPALAQSVLAQAAFVPGQRFMLSGYADYGARLAISPDGAHALVPDVDGNIALIDLQNQQALTTYDMGGAMVWGVGFLPDAERFVVALSDGTLGVYDLATGEEQDRITFIEEGDLSPEQSYVDLWSLGVSDDGRFVAAGAQEGVLKVVDLTSGAVRRLEGHTDAIWGLDFDADAERLLSSSEDGSIILWDLNNGEMLNRCHPNPDSDEYNAAWDVVFTPDGQQALVGYEDFSMRLWDLEDCQLIHRFVGHTNRIWSVDVSPNGKLALSASYDSVIRLWDVKTGEAVRSYLGHDSAVFDAKFTPDNLHFLSLGGDTTLRYWDIENGAEEMRVKPHAARITTVLTLADNQLVSTSHDGTVKIIDVSTGDMQSLPVTFSAVYAAALSPDAQYLLIGGDAVDESAANLVLWNFATEEATELAGHSGGVYAVTFSPDGQFAFSGGDDAQIIQWNVADGAQVNVFEGAESRIRSLSVNPDNTLLAAGETNNLARIWDIATQEQRYELAHNGVVYHVVFSADGARLLTSSEDRSIRIWDTNTFTLMSRLDGHNRDVFDAEFSPDGSLIASASLDGTIRVWDVARSAEIQLLSGHQGGVTTIEFSPDGRTLFSGGVDGTVRVWSLKTPQEILAWLNDGNRTVPELTCEQRAQYFIEPLCEGSSD